MGVGLGGELGGFWASVGRRIDGLSVWNFPSLRLRVLLGLGWLCCGWLGDGLCGGGRRGVEVFEGGGETGALGL